jgi:hypothetical protein
LQYERLRTLVANLQADDKLLLERLDHQGTKRYVMLEGRSKDVAALEQIVVRVGECAGVGDKVVLCARARGKRKVDEQRKRDQVRLHGSVLILSWGVSANGPFRWPAT